MGPLVGPSIRSTNWSKLTTWSSRPADPSSASSKTRSNTSSTDCSTPSVSMIGLRSCSWRTGQGRRERKVDYGGVRDGYLVLPVSSVTTSAKLLRDSAP